MHIKDIRNYPTNKTNSTTNIQLLLKKKTDVFTEAPVSDIWTDRITW